MHHHQNLLSVPAAFTEVLINEVIFYEGNKIIAFRYNHVFWCLFAERGERERGSEREGEKICKKKMDEAFSCEM